MFHGWSFLTALLIEDEKQLFNDNIEAGTHGPIIQTVLQKFKANITITKSNLETNDANLTEDEKESIDSAIEMCKEYNGNQLEIFTISTDPYIKAKKEWH